MVESLVVAEYIAEEYGSGGLVAHSSKDRATVRLFTELCGGCFSYFPILRAKEGEDRNAAVQTLQEGLVNVNAFLKHHSKKGPFVLGEHFSLAEANVAPFVQRACTILPAMVKENGKAVDPLQLCNELGLARLEVWIKAVLNRPSVQTTGVAKEQLLESTKKMLERFAAMEANKK